VCAHLIGTFLIDVKFHNKWQIMEFLGQLVKKSTIHSFIFVLAYCPHYKTFL